MADLPEDVTAFRRRYSNTKQTCGTDVSRAVSAMAGSQGSGAS